jgi:membrane protein
MNRALTEARRSLGGFLRDVRRQMARAQLSLVASSLAFTTILSAVPLLAVSFAMFKALGGTPRLYETVEPFILENLAEGTSDGVIAMIHRFIDNANAGAIGVGGMIALFITSVSMLSSVEKAIGQVWGAKAQRPFLQRYASYCLLIAVGPIALAVALGAATSGGLPITRLLPSGWGEFVLEAFGLALVYKFVPSERVHFPSASFAGLLTALLLAAARAAFLVYVRRAISYGTIYGSLGALPIVLLWIYIAWVVVLSGAAVTAALQRRLGDRRLRAR